MHGAVKEARNLVSAWRGSAKSPSCPLLAFRGPQFTPHIYRTLLYRQLKERYSSRLVIRLKTDAACLVAGVEILKIRCEEDDGCPTACSDGHTNQMSGV